MEGVARRKELPRRSTMGQNMQWNKVPAHRITRPGLPAKKTEQEEERKPNGFRICSGTRARPRGREGGGRKPNGFGEAVQSGPENK